MSIIAKQSKCGHEYQGEHEATTLNLLNFKYCGNIKLSGKNNNKSISDSVCCNVNPILGGVRDTPIMDGEGAKRPPSQFNSAIWCLTTMKLGRNRV